MKKLTLLFLLFFSLILQAGKADFILSACKNGALAFYGISLLSVANQIANHDELLRRFEQEKKAQLTQPPMRVQQFIRDILARHNFKAAQAIALRVTDQGSWSIMMNGKLLMINRSDCALMDRLIEKREKGEKLTQADQEWLRLYKMIATHEWGHVVHQGVNERLKADFGFLLGSCIGWHTVLRSLEKNMPRQPLFKLGMGLNYLLGTQVPVMATRTFDGIQMRKAEYQADEYALSSAASRAELRAFTNHLANCFFLEVDAINAGRIKAYEPLRWMYAMSRSKNSFGVWLNDHPRLKRAIHFLAGSSHPLTEDRVVHAERRRVERFGKEQRGKT
jgi:hypothetical protein